MRDLYFAMNNKCINLILDNIQESVQKIIVEASNEALYSTVKRYSDEQEITIRTVLDDVISKCNTIRRYTHE